MFFIPAKNIQMDVVGEDEVGTSSSKVFLHFDFHLNSFTTDKRIGERD